MILGGGIVIEGWAASCGVLWVRLCHIVGDGGGGFCLSCSMMAAVFITSLLSSSIARVLFRANARNENVRGLIIMFIIFQISHWEFLERRVKNFQLSLIFQKLLGNAEGVVEAFFGTVCLPGVAQRRL